VNDIGFVKIKLGEKYVVPETCILGKTLDIFNMSRLNFAKVPNLGKFIWNFKLWRSLLGIANANRIANYS
jgi:hypothetical protein